MIRLFNFCAWTRLCVGLLLILGLCATVGATNLTGTFKNPDGSPVNGKIIFLLSQPARLNDQSAQIVPMVKIFSVTNGALESGAFVYGNDVLVPGGTYYLVRLVDSNNNLLFEQKWSISGVNLNLGTLTPTTTGVVFPDPLIKNLATDQAVQGPVSFSAPVTAFSLTLNGNLNPGLPDSYELGSASAPWQELHAQRWNSLFAVGSSGGTAMSPAAAPGATVISNGGSIGAGTYYFKITYFNKNGETTASPVSSVTISSGATNRVYIGNADNFWASGCYGYIVYASNDGTNFYAQAPSGAATDFQVSGVGGKTGHYIGLGSYGARFDSLTFSGATPQTTNTASIDPLQVALNATMRQSDYAVALGTLFVPAVASGYTLTTPLIVPRYAKIIGGSHMGVASTSAGQSRITGNWTDPKLAVVMAFGGFSDLEGLEIYGPGNAVMFIAGVGLQSTYQQAKNSGFRTTDNTNTYYALKIVGVHYRMHTDNVYLRGGKAAIGIANASGGSWVFENTRWDLGGPSAIKSVPSWTDPDNGAHDGSFPFAIADIVLRNIDTEVGTGIIWDCVGLGMEFDNVRGADGAIVGGTDSIAKFGTDVTYGGAPGPIMLRDTSFGTSSNTRVGTMWGGSQQGNIYAYGNSSFGVGSASGNQQTVDLNNVGAMIIVDRAGAFGSLDPAAAATTPHPINLNANTFVDTVGDFGGGVSVVRWHEIMGRLAISPKAGGVSDRANRTSILTNAFSSSAFEVQKNDDATYLMQLNQSGLANFRYNLRVQATGGGAATLFVGPSGSTAAGGSVSLVNQGSVQARNGANNADIVALQVQSDDTVHVGTANSQGVRIGNSGSTPIKRIISATATLDFGSITAPGCASDLTITATGANLGDVVSLGAPNGSVPTGMQFFAWVSAVDTVTVRACAFTGTQDPASGSFRVTVIKL